MVLQQQLSYPYLKYLAFYPIEDYPIFVKRGSIIPMAADESLMSFKNPKTLEIHVFPGESNTYHLYEDDGESNRYYLKAKG